MSEFIIQAEHLKKQYDDGSGRTIEVLQDISLGLTRGKIHFILGHSGAGKSTLLHLLGGLDRPTAGDVQFEGKSLGRMSERELAHFRNAKIGFLFQFYHLIPELTLTENVMLPALMARDPRARVRAEALVERVGLSERRNHLPSQLSGGERQRGALARALVNDPALVLCDEPTGNLDEMNRAMVYDLIEVLNRERAMTFLIVTHEESYVKTWSGKDAGILRLARGRIQAEHPIDHPNL